MLSKLTFLAAKSDESSHTLFVQETFTTNMADNDTVQMIIIITVIVIAPTISNVP